jgi:hypothetical protein
MYRDLEDGTRADRNQSVPTGLERLRTRISKDHEHNHDEQRTAYELRDKNYRLNALETKMLSDIGKFRAIEKADLLRSIYKGQQEAFDRDLRHLHRQNLVRIVGPKGSVTKYIALTKPAKQLTEKHLRSDPRQEIYAGAVKLRELKHDAALYRLYQKAASEIEQRGGRPVRIVLDYELKRNINRELAKTKDLSRQKQQQGIRETAEQQHLKVVGSKIPIPDLRIEYETPEGEREMCDLEYVTEHYRDRSITEKRAAGFKLYGSEHRGRRPYGPDLVGGLISL